MFWLILGVVALGLLYWRLSKPHKYWQELGVPCSDPFPIFGDTHIAIFRKGSFIDVPYRAYFNFPNRRYVGVYQMLQPVLLIRDPELLKQILVKDFDHFPNHYEFIPPENDPMWAKNVFNLTGPKWKDMRSTISPMFTSSKMKTIYKLMDECADNFTGHFVEKPEGEVYDMKDFFQRFATDVIASTSFGIKVDSWTEKNHEFYVNGKQATDLNGFLPTLRLTVFMLSTKLAKWMHLRLFSEEVTNFFTGLIQDTLRIREEKGIIRQDMIQLMMDARKGQETTDDSAMVDTGFSTAQETYTKKSFNKVEITDDHITANSIGIFFAGFESFSTTISFLAHELAVNQEIQERLRAEVDQTLSECDGRVTYEALMKMKYMDMVISETLRKWPSTPFSDRKAAKPYTIKATTPEEKDLHLPVDTLIWVPIHAIQRDPEYYPDPDRFDPERFSDENKGKINPYTFLTFGAGPRNCMGSRFALLEMKIIMFYLMSRLELVVCEKTCIPLKLRKTGFSPMPEGGFYLRVKPRGNK